jgi:hypothetical protein
MGLFVIARCPRPSGGRWKKRAILCLSFTVVKLMVVTQIVRALWSKEIKECLLRYGQKKRKECFYCLSDGLTSCWICDNLSFYSIGPCFVRFCPLQLSVIEETKVEPKFTPCAKFVTIFFSAIGRCFARFCLLQFFAIWGNKIGTKGGQQKVLWLKYYSWKQPILFLYFWM